MPTQDRKSQCQMIVEMFTVLSLSRRRSLQMILKLYTLCLVVL